MAYKYYIVKCGVEIPQAGLMVTGIFGERQYIAEIDMMAGGWAMYTRRLKPWEIAKAELISQPREDG